MRVLKAVLLHGLGRSARSMLPVERALVRRGYDVLNIGYRSRSANVATLAGDIARRVRHWGGDAPVDFVTHSLGGIIVRAMVAEGHLARENIHRVVMLGPPNGGSELADVLPTIPVVGRIYRRITGPAGLELGVGPGGIAARLPAVVFELGVIAGTRSFNPLFSAILGEENDGKVRVSRTKVPGMSDFIALPHWHPTLMAAPRIVRQTIHFLEFGHFQR